MERAISYIIMQGISELFSTAFESKNTNQSSAAFYNPGRSMVMSNHITQRTTYIDCSSIYEAIFPGGSE